MSKKSKAKPAVSSASVTPPRTRLWEMLAIFIAVFIVYGNSIKNDYNLDDAYVVSLDAGNTLTQKGIKGIPEILQSPYSAGEGVTYGYRPLGRITMAIEYDLWGNNPQLSHFVNVLLFAINCILLLRFLQKIGVEFKYDNQVVNYLATLLFIVHPIHTEVVCSIKNREEILCFIFILLSLLTFIRFYKNRKLIFIIPISLFTVLAFLSKQTAIVLLGIVPVYVFLKYLDANASRDFATRTYQRIKLVGKVLLVVLAGMYLTYQIPIWITALSSDNVFFLYVGSLLLLSIYRQNKQGNIISKLRTGKSIAIVILSIALLNLFFLSMNDMDRDSVLDIVLINLAAVTAAVKLRMVMLERSFAFKLPGFKRDGSKDTITAKGAFRAWHIVAVVFIALFVLAGLLMNYEPTVNNETAEVSTAYEQNPYHFAETYHFLPNGVQTFFFYLKKLLIPYPLAFYYGYNTLPLQDLNSVFSYWGLLLIVVLGVVIYLCVKRSNFFLLFWLFFFFITLFPFLNVVENKFVTGIVGERLVYQASFAFCILLAMGIYAMAFLLSTRWGFERKKVMRTSYIMSSPLIVIFIALTVIRNEDWINKSTLFQRDIPHLSNSARANYMVASNYMIELSKANPYATDQAYYVQNARKHLEQALRVYPEYDAALLGMAILHYRYLKAPDSAMISLAAIDSTNVNEYVRAKELMGDISYLDKKDTLAALQHYREGFRFRSKYSELYNKIIQVCFELKRFNEVLYFSNIGVSNGWVQGYIDRGDAYYAMGKIDEAIKNYEIAMANGFRGEKLVQRVQQYYSGRGNVNR